MNHLKEILDTKEMSAYRLSQLSGIDEARISRILKGKIKDSNLTIKTLYRLSTALGVDIFDIVDKEDL